MRYYLGIEFFLAVLVISPKPTAAQQQQPPQDPLLDIVKFINDLLSAKEKSGQCKYCEEDTSPPANGVFGKEYKNECFRKCNEGDLPTLKSSVISDYVERRDNAGKTKMKSGSEQRQTASAQETNGGNHSEDYEMQLKCDHCKSQGSNIVEGLDGKLYANNCYQKCHEGKRNKGSKRTRQREMPSMPLQASQIIDIFSAPLQFQPPGMMSPSEKNETGTIQTNT